MSLVSFTLADRSCLKTTTQNTFALLGKNMMDDRWVWCGGVLSCLLTHSYILTLTSVLRYAVHSHEEKERTFLVYKILKWYSVKICVFFLVLVCLDLGRSFSETESPDLKLSLLVPGCFFFIHGLHLRHVEKCAVWQETKASDNHILPCSWLSWDQNMFFCSDFSTWCHDFLNCSENSWPVQQWIINYITAGHFFCYWCHNIQHS